MFATVMSMVTGAFLTVFSASVIAVGGMSVVTKTKPATLIQNVMDKF